MVFRRKNIGVNFDFASTITISVLAFLLECKKIHKSLYKEAIKIRLMFIVFYLADIIN